MLRHVVLFKKRPETSEETVQEIMRRLEALQGQIPGLTYIKCHRSLPSDRPVVYTFMLDSTLERADQLQGYLQHPAHVAVNEWMSPYLESRAVVDYEV
ncbi:MAG: Dabb family protein [Chloroflexota bacterium]